MQRKNYKKPEWQTNIARERIEKLIELAEKNVSSNPDQAKRCIRLAIKIGMRYTIRLPAKQKRLICKGCFILLVPGLNCVVRASKKRMAMTKTCKLCGSVKRFPYRKEKSSK